MEKFNSAIDKIVSFEWDMFQSVNEGGPKASCQEDRVTFEGMRRGQFEAWSEEAVESYLYDVTDAILEGRNLVTEKYIHMMKNTSPISYEQLKPMLPQLADGVEALASEIAGKLVEQTETLHEQYPYVSGSGRPLRSVSDFTGVTSIETYQLGELLTYSLPTLNALKKQLYQLETEGKLLARLILENSVRHYGYKSLEDAEAATRDRIDKIGIQITYGCDCDNSCGDSCGV